MGIGPLVRRAFGRHERRISEAYRAIFVDLDAFVASIQAHAPSPSHVLEIGCGEGAVAERLAIAFPRSTLTGIDICSRPGRLYDGDRARVRFLRTSSADLSATEHGRYQLVIIADVLHHVPYSEWGQFLSSARALMAEDGTLILKEWVRRPTPMFLLCYLLDRFVTGDRIRYPSEAELRLLAKNSFGEDAICSEFRIRPWHCNLTLVISRKKNHQQKGGKHK